jgi:HAD superfamily hydrolase (TIGR01549 family)
MLKLIILDFDGVIVESMDIKIEAFRKLFSDYPKYVDAIIWYHERNCGVSRYEKFSHIYENILKQPLSDEKLAELDKRFSALVVDGIKSCPFVPGVLEFLENYAKKMKLFIISSTPEKELRYLVGERGLQKYFRGVYGAPSKKSEIALQIIKEERVGKKEALFVGDTAEDYIEAKKAGVLFIGRVVDLASCPFPGDVKIVRDLNELSTLVEGLLSR